MLNDLPLDTHLESGIESLHVISVGPQDLEYLNSRGQAATCIA